MKIVIYANCQGIGIKYFLRKHQNLSNCEIIHIRLDELAKGITDLNSNTIYQFKTCDILIFQHLKDKKYGNVTTDNIKNILKSNCKTISFPYIYNNSFYPVKGPLIIKQSHISKPCSIIYDNSQTITSLIDNGKSLKEIIEMYKNSAIDFNYHNRWEYTQKTLKDKEVGCDIAVSNFIADNFKKERLFLLSNHPSSVIFIYVVNKILDILDMSPINIPVYGLNDCNLPGGIIPMDSSSIKHFNFEYDIDVNDDYFIKIISNIYLFYTKYG